MVTSNELFQALELGMNDGPKEMKQKAAAFKLLWDEATPEVREKQDAAGNTLLHQMIIYGFNDLAKWAITEMPKLALKHNKQQGEYPIHLAISHQNLEVVDALFKVSGVASQRNDRRQTIMHYAGRYGTQDMATLCCRHRVLDINAKDSFGKTALAWAREENSPDVEAVLIAHGARNGF